MRPVRRRPRTGVGTDRTFPLPAVAEDPLDHVGLATLDEGKDLHLPAAARALQLRVFNSRVCLPNRRKLTACKSPQYNSARSLSTAGGWTSRRELEISLRAFGAHDRSKFVRSASVSSPMQFTEQLNSPRPMQPVPLDDGAAFTASVVFLPRATFPLAGSSHHSPGANLVPPHSWLRP
jgi:hypothetical protein